MHNMLERQIKRHLGKDAEVPPAWQPLLHAISQAYDAFDKDRLLLERSLELSSIEMMQANAELARHRDHLEKMVEQRTAMAELARERAVEANRAKSIFLNKMSHELRTPLNAILGYAQLCAKRSTDSQVNKGIRIIQQSGEQLLRLINDILSISQIETGQIALESVPIDLTNLLKQLITSFAPSAQRKNIDLRLEYHEPLPGYVMADEARLLQILSNLLDNAITFTFDGSVTLRVIQRKHDDDTILTRFEVADTGIGIEPGLLPALFEPFQQHEPSHQHTGIGLGLPICRNLVRLMGGELMASSSPGKGSLFWFEINLPYPSPDDTAQVPAPAPIAPEQTDPPPPSDVIPPQRDVVDALLELARMGDLDEIRNQAELVKANAPRHAAFAEKLIAWTWAFEEQTILKFLEQTRERMN